MIGCCPPDKKKKKKEKIEIAGGPLENVVKIASGGNVRRNRIELSNATRKVVAWHPGCNDRWQRHLNSAAPPN